MHKILMAGLALGLFAGSAAAAGFPEKAESRIYWKDTQMSFVEPGTAPLAVAPSLDPNFAGGFYGGKVAVDPLYVVPDTDVPSIHLKNR
jgi:hypothetical protein